MRIKKSLLVFVFVLTLFVPILFVRNANAAATFVKVAPKLVSAEPNQNFKVNITISDVYDLFGWQFYLEWNSSLLEYLNVTEGPFLKANTPSPLGTQFVTQIGQDNNGTDFIFVGCTTLGASYRGVGGSGVLATVEFKAENLGNTALHLYNVKLRNSFKVAIEPSTGPPDYYFTNLVDGRFVNVGVPVASFNFTPAVPKINEEISFNASESRDSNVNGTLVEYFWDFGDSSNATENDDVTTHTYTKAGYFTVSLTVTDNDNLTNTATALIRIRYPHDVAVLSLSSYSPKVSAGEKVPIYVTVSNEGLSTESFTVTVFYENTAAGSEQNVINLAALQTKNLTFTWDTSGVAPGIYRIKAVASTVDGESTEAQANNSKLGSTVEIAAVTSTFPIEIVAIGVVAAVVAIGGGLFFLRRRGKVSSPTEPPA